MAGSEQISGPGSIRTTLHLQSLASAAIALATTGSGLFIGFNATASATSGIDTYITAYDASAVGSAVYDFTVGGLPSAGARVLWNTQVRADTSAAADLAVAIVNPPQPIPFFRGLIVGATTLNSTAAGSTGVNITTLFQSQK